jgi:hypothetical protein
MWDCLIYVSLERMAPDAFSSSALDVSELSEPEPDLVSHLVSELSASTLCLARCGFLTGFDSLSDALPPPKFLLLQRLPATTASSRPSAY